MGTRQTNDPVSSLEALVKMRERNLITEAEYQAKRTELLAGMGGATSSPASRQEAASQYRAQTGWWLLELLMIGVGLVAGFVVGAYVAAPFKSNGLLYLAIGWLVGPGIGAFVGWWLWTSLWARR